MSHNVPNITQLANGRTRRATPAVWAHGHCPMGVHYWHLLGTQKTFLIILTKMRWLNKHNGVAGAMLRAYVTPFEIHKTSMG